MVILVDVPIMLTKAGVTRSMGYGRLSLYWPAGRSPCLKASSHRWSVPSPSLDTFPSMDITPMVETQ